MRGGDRLEKLFLSGSGKDNHFEFPGWTDKVVKLFAGFSAIGAVFYIWLIYYATSPLSMDVGYQPVQPVPYSHELHAGQLGIDCRYCHNTVEYAAYAAIPPSQTCMNCHKTVMAESDKLVLIRESYSSGRPVEWVKVHDLPDYVYFDHSAHVTRGVSCAWCHGRVDKMEVVFQAKSLRMGWCLECHRNPEKYLRPKEFVTQLDWQPMEDQLVMGNRLKEAGNINPSDDCSTCHR